MFGRGLLDATRTNDLDKVMSLLDEGVDPNDENERSGDLWPIHWAAWHVNLEVGDALKKFEILKELLRAGADPNPCPWQDDTSLTHIPDEDGYPTRRPRRKIEDEDGKQHLVVSPLGFVKQTNANGDEVISPTARRELVQLLEDATLVKASLELEPSDVRRELVDMWSLQCAIYNLVHDHGISEQTWLIEQGKAKNEEAEDNPKAMARYNRMESCNGVQDLINEAEAAYEVHLLSTPWNDVEGRKMAAAEKKRLDDPENGVLCFDPNEDIVKVAKHKGWTQEEQERRWLMVFERIKYIIKKKREEDPENRSSLRVMCNGQPPPHPEDAGPPELLGNAQPGELLGGLSAGFKPVPPPGFDVHPGVRCDVSGMCPIVGNRYMRPNENFDLCEAEFNKLDRFDKRDFVLVPPPTRAGLVWVIYHSRVKPNERVGEDYPDGPLLIPGPEPGASGGGFLDKVAQVKEALGIEESASPKDAIEEANAQMGLHNAGPLPKQVEALMGALGL